MENSMLKVGGQHFRCICGANVFHKGVKPGLWICNGCGTEYTDETYDHRKTNANRIRAMSDEELAAFLEHVHVDPCSACCDNLYWCRRNNAPEPVCKNHFLEWLQQPAEEGT